LTPRNWPTQLKARADQVASVEADNAAVDTAQTNLDYTSIGAQRRMGVRLIDPETPCTLPIQSRSAR
jgi:hypothetical protein